MAQRDPAGGGSKSESKTSAKHVVIFDGRPSDGGSIPPASTKFLQRKNLEHWKLEIGTIENSNAVYALLSIFLSRYFAQQKITDPYDRFP